MACLIKDSRKRSPYWICAYTAPDGTRVKRSTKQVDKENAWQVCLSFVEAEQAVATRSATDQQLRRVIDAARRRLGEAPMLDATVRETLETWIKSKSGAVKASSVKEYRLAAKLFVGFLGPRADASVRLITKRDAVSFRDWLAQSRAAATANKLKSFVRSAFQAAKEEGIIEQNVFALADNLKTVGVERDVFSPGQVARLVEAARSEDWKGAIILGYTSAARLMDVVNMRWSNVDLENGLLNFSVRKTGKRALIALHEDFADWLEGRRRPADGQAYLFPSLACEDAAPSGRLSMQFSRIVARAGISGRKVKSEGGSKELSSYVFHSLRHSSASSVYNNAALENIAKRVTGHASGAIRKYVHEDLEVLRQAVKLIPRLPKAQE
jgi:integrase